MVRFNHDGVNSCLSLPSCFLQKQFVRVAEHFFHLLCFNSFLIQNDNKTKNPFYKFANHSVVLSITLIKFFFRNWLDSVDSTESWELKKSSSKMFSSMGSELRYLWLPCPYVDMLYWFQKFQSPLPNYGKTRMRLIMEILYTNL